MQFIKIFDRLMSEVLSLYWIKLLKLEKNYLVTNRITSVYKLPQMHTSPLRIQRSLMWVQQTAVAFSFLSINCFCSYFFFSHKQAELEVHLLWNCKEEIFFTDCRILWSASFKMFSISFWRHCLNYVRNWSLLFFLKFSVKV